MSFLDNTGLAYFYSKLKEKFIRSVTAGNDVLTPDASGNVNIVNVPTASNLTSPDAQTSYGTFIYRTSGGSASLTSGDAQLMYVDGNIEVEGRIPENFNITATNNIIVSYNAETWRTSIDTSGTYYFRYARPSDSTARQTWSATGVWTSDGVGEVILSTYGLSVSGVVDPSISASVSGSGISSATVVPSTFAAAVDTDGMYEFVYSTINNSWQYLSENILLADYGIAVSGTPNDADVVTINFIAGTPDSVVTVVYTAATQGTIKVATPTGFSATGFNQFDKDTMFIENATFANGAIASGANYVAYCRAKGGVDNGYVAYSEGEYILGIGWCATLPAIGTVITTTDAAVSSSLASIPFADDGYVVIEVTNMDDLCVHPKWSGSADTDYAAYVAPSVITFPLEDVEGVDLPLKTYGIPRIGAVVDTLDLDAGTYIQRIGRLAYTPANMSTVISYGTAYDYDDNWIYYVLPQQVTYSVDVSPDYIVNDWGTEEFLGTNVAVSMQTLYSQNLRDKLRTDVLTISTQTPSLTDNQKMQVLKNIGLSNYVNPNLLDNWYFVGGGSQQGGGQFPINQRGQTSYSGAVYGIDRWIGGDTVTVASGYITVAKSSSTVVFRQRHPLSFWANLAGKIVTLSFLTSTGLATATMRLPSSTTGTWDTEQAVLGNWTMDIQGSPSENVCAVRLFNTGQAASVNLIAVKLELGSTQTLAHQENGVWVLNEIPNFADELARCQRYYYRTNLANDQFGTLGLASAADASSVNLILSIPVTMRATPSITYSDTIRFQVGSTYYSATAPTFSVYNRSAGGMQIHITGFSGLTAGEFGLCFTSTNGTLNLSADL